MLSVCMITYNHGHYIAQAIESVLNQVVNFEYELIIGEDCSSDNTRAVCEEYAAKYSGRIRLLPSDKNLGMSANGLRTIEACTGKYMAILEGDDYWTDRNKLQKQVDFMEQNPDYSICFTAIEVLNDVGDKFDLPAPFLNFDKDTYTVEDILSHPPEKPISIPMMTWVSRRYEGFVFPDFYKNAIQPDTALTLLMGMKGKFRFMNEITAVYRHHLGGITKTKEFNLRFDRAMFDLIDAYNDYTGHKHHEVIKKRLFSMAKTLLMYGTSLLSGAARKEHIGRMIKGYNKYRIGFNPKEIVYYTIVLFFPSLLNLFKKFSK